MLSNLYLIIVVILLCVVSLLNKAAIGRTDVFTIQWVQSLVSLTLLPLWLYLSKKVGGWSNFNWLAAGYAAGACLVSTVSFIFFLSALKNKSVSVATACLSTYPAILMSISILMGIEKFNLLRALGIFLITFGVILTQVTDS